MRKPPAGLTRPPSRGTPTAQYNLGNMHDLRSEGVPQDYVLAYALVSQGLAEHGDAGAQYNLGVRQDNGEGVPQDHAEAIRWLIARPPSRGIAGAQYNLGVMHDNGRGVPRDHAEAIRWYRKAADQGHAGAQYNLGIMHANQRGRAA